MNRVSITDVEWINVHILAIIRAELQHDMAATCCRFALSTEQANFIRSLRLDELWSRAFQIGDTTLFPPRADLVQLLSTPPNLAGAFSLVSPPAPPYLEPRR